MAREFWRPVSYPGLEGECQANTLGRNPPCEGEATRGRWRKRAWQVLTTYSEKDDPYARVGLYINGKRSNVRVHLLVLWAFKGPPKPGQIARHLNDNKRDNRLGNLKWGTYNDNLEDAIRNGRVRRLGKARAAAIRERFAAGPTTKGLTEKIANDFGISAVSVCAVIRGETYAEAA